MTWRQIQALADRLEPDIRRAWLRAVRVLRARLTPAVVDAMLAAGSEIALSAALSRAVSDATLAPLLKTVEAGLIQSLRQTAARSVLRGGFNQANPYAIQIARRLAGDRIVAISRTVRRVVRAEVVAAMRGDQTPQQVARRIRDIVGLTPAQQRHLSRRRDALAAEGLSADAVARQVGKLAAQWTRQRAQTIARTEAMTAANGGQVVAWQAAIRAGTLPPDARKRWVVTPDDRLCPICRPMAGQTVPVGADFASAENGGTMSPPLHPNCRCAVVLVVERVQVAPIAADAA